MPAFNLRKKGFILQQPERNRFRDFNRYHLGAGGMYRYSARLGEKVRSVTIAGLPGNHDG